MPIHVGIMGATGLVGQRLVSLLADHPWFETAVVAASERSIGRSYREATRWALADPPPVDVMNKSVVACDGPEIERCELVFSALDAPIARELEPGLARRGAYVVSNSSAFREAPGVPLLIPEVNASHLRLLQCGDASGGLVTNPNCSVTGLALVLAPLHRQFGVRRLVVTTLQAVSGAGISGPTALELLDNVVPFIPGEEPKLESELGKLLGTVEDGDVRRAPILTSAHCHRVATVDGHLEAVSVELEGGPSPDQVRDALEGFRGEVHDDRLPSAPDRPILLRNEDDRPQPRLDRNAGGGMSVVVGRVRGCPALGIKFELLSHNAIRGAAGGTLLNAELLVARGFLGERPSR